MTNTNHHAWLKNHKVEIGFSKGEVDIAIKKKQVAQPVAVVQQPPPEPKKPWTADEIVFVCGILFAVIALGVVVGKRIRKSYRYSP